MYDEYDDGEDGSSLGRKVAMGVGVVAIIAAGFFAFRAVSGGDGGQVAPASGASVSVSAPEQQDAPTGGDDAVGDATTTEPTTETTTETTEDTVTDSIETADVPETTATTATSTTVAPTTTTTTTAPAAPAPPAPETATYETLPDGSPAWVVAIFGPDSISISGAVPDQASKDRLESLAVANAKPGQTARIDNQLTINPAVPRNVGVRVVELTSVRFPESSAEILPPHAAELDRVVNIMNALPNITALVIGHADQRGDETANFVLSEARADAVTTYLASRGISPSRLASRAVGEADLLTLNNDDAAFELNRRTEFVFFGLLVG